MMLSRCLSTLAALSGLLLQGQGAPQAFRLPTGLACLLVENHERPLVRMELKVNLAPALEPWARNGMVGFLACLLESTGAGPYGRAEFNRAADDLGLVLAFEGRRDAFTWRVLTDSRSQEPAFELLANAVFRPAFDSPAVEAQRQALIKKAVATPARDGAFARFLWQLREPGATLVPGGADLDHLELQDLQRLHRGLVRPEHATLVLYGDLSLAQAKELALLHFGVWGPAPVPLPASHTVGSQAGAHFSALLEGGSRTELWAGAPRSGPGRADVEAVLALLLERASQGPLGGLELTLQPNGPLLIKASPRAGASDALVAGLVEALDALRTKGFAGEDLSRAKILWRARKATAALHPETLVRQVLQDASTPVSEAAVEALALKDVNEALGAWLDPAQLRFLLLGGDASEVQAAEKAGLGPVALVKP